MRRGYTNAHLDYLKMFQRKCLMCLNQVLLRGGGLIGEGGLFERGGLLISWENYIIIFLQHKEMCVKQLCILIILTQLYMFWDVQLYIFQLFNYIYVLRCSWHVWCVMLFLRKWKQISWNLFYLKLHIFLLIGGGGLNREGGLNKYLHLKRGGLLERGAYLRGGAK